ncbi:MAG TPA: hypothetical protein VFK21_06275 [Gammaproteobacteria bacterium]|nr:hypothetical protein [Gammaproteobacteria bacterium]
MRRMFVLGVLGVAILAACSSVSPLQQDQPLMLAAGDGIAVVQFDTLDPLSQIQIVSPQSGGKTLTIPSAPVGKSTYVFEVPAGRYCLVRFWFGNYLLSHENGYVGCFEVPAGQVGFSGIYSPRSQGGQVVAGQDLDVTDAKAQLRQSYPHIAAQFLQPEPAPLPTAAPQEASAPAAAPATASASVPPPPGKDLLSTWITHDDRADVDSIYVRNNTKWTMEITTFEFYDCANIKQPCKVTHPNFKLKPNETKVYTQVQRDDPQGAYSFHYRFAYGFD